MEYSSEAHKMKGKFKAKIEDIKQAQQELYETKRAENQMKAMAKNYPRWMEYTAEKYNKECTKPDDIEWNDPFIVLDSFFCDLYNIKHWCDDEFRTPIMSKWSADVLEEYYKKNDKGESYSMFEQKHIIAKYLPKAVKNAVKEQFRNKKKRE